MTSHSSASSFSSGAGHAAASASDDGSFSASVSASGATETSQATLNNPPETASLSGDFLQDHERLLAEYAELKDRFLRSLADMENLRRRSEKEIQEARLYSVANFARDMLSFSDNLERALGALPEQGREDPLWAPMLEGLTLIGKDFMACLARHGVQPMEAAGEKFDPHSHEALFDLPTSEVPPGTIVQTIEKGYRLGERVLRPAKVAIARAEPT